MKKGSGETKAAAKVAKEEPLTSLRDHPDAGPAIRRIRAAGGLAGFGVAALIGVEQASPFPTMVLRALEVGLASQTVAWAAGVLVCKRLLIAQAGVVARTRRRRVAAAASATAQAGPASPTGARVE